MDKIISKITKNQELKYSIINLFLLMVGIFGLIFVAFISQDEPQDDLLIPTSLELANCVANYNQDGVVDNLDLVLFIKNYRKENIECRFDLTGDCFLDTKDYAGFATQFGSICN